MDRDSELMLAIDFLVPQSTHSPLVYLASDRAGGGCGVSGDDVLLQNSGYILFLLAHRLYDIFVAQ